jgi:LacI family transcriptional regulator
MKNAKNITELASWLNLSVATVSRVLNGKGESYRISEATIRRVFEAAKQFNYSPNRIARGLKLEKTDTLGLIIPDVANNFFASIAKTIELEARKNGYSIILCDSLDDETAEFELLNLLAGRKVDGVIIAPVGQNAQHVKNMQDTGMPVIVIDRYFPGIPIPYITTDNYAGSFDAVEHMISQGHKKIACIQGVKNTSPNTDRVRGYMDALKKHGIRPDPSLITGNDYGEQNGYVSTLRLMEPKDRPTAILTLSNLITLGALRALKEKGHRIPNDISIISFDEQPYSAFLECPMTTIEQQRDEIGTLAVKNVLELMKNKGTKDDTQILIKPRLIIRESVKNMNT